MKPALRVISPGLMTTIQDLGRIGYQHFGVPVSGALDPVGLYAANALVDNAAGTAALEVFYMGLTLAVEADDVRISVVGADAKIEILPDATAKIGKRVECMRSLRLSRGEVLRIGSLSGGALLYVAVEGGFNIEPILGSVSTYMRGQIGGLNGRALVAGDRIPLRRNRASESLDLQLNGLDLTTPARFRIIPGPQRDYFSDNEFAAFVGSTYVIGPNSDRMGMRLSGRPITHIRGFDIVSDGIAPGSVQIPGNGQPIVLLADRQTTGGYPKIATVISADLPALGRIGVGARIGFEPVALEAAVEARRKLLADLAAIESRVAPIQPTGKEVTPKLLECNLISGVIDAAA
jgi:biotin-dependent carboxylase-like uncharacterized protein